MQVVQIPAPAEPQLAQGIDLLPAQPLTAIAVEKPRRVSDRLRKMARQAVQEDAEGRTDSFPGQ